jgi:hypothetical protein
MLIYFIYQQYLKLILVSYNIDLQEKAGCTVEKIGGYFYHQGVFTPVGIGVLHRRNDANAMKVLERGGFS